MVAVLRLMAFVSAANGAWMLVAPERWFTFIPGVPDTGPLNHHLVRDVGCSYLAIAVAFILVARRPRDGYPLMLVVSTFLGLHALLHIWDIAAKRLSFHHALTDLPGVFLPAIVAGAVTILLRPRGERRSPE